MRIAFFDTHADEGEAFDAANVTFRHEIVYFEPRLRPTTASLAAGFFWNLSEQVLQDDVLASLLTFPNVPITAHQAFLTREALAGIATTTLENVTVFETRGNAENEVHAGALLQDAPGSS